MGSWAKMQRNWKRAKDRGAYVDVFHRMLKCGRKKV